VIPKTRYVLLSIALVAAAAATTDKAFHVGKADEYSHQSGENVIIGAKPYDTEDLVTEAFGKKVDLLHYGVLPVLVVIENKRDRTIDLRNIEVNLVGADGRHVNSVPPEEIPHLGARSGPPRAPTTGSPIPLPRKKNKLDGPEIVARAFAAKMLPPGDSASGFFYFEAKSEPGDKLYLNGLRDTPAGHDILYFEFEMTR
jgi:hypothetical protein